MSGTTYTPHGIPRAPGYYDPHNPYDTGRTGERNSEHGGGKNTMPGWDYDAGQARAGAYQDANGVWQMPGGGGGYGGGAAYGQYAAQAKLAYDQAMARIKAERTSTRADYGFNAEGTQLDGMNFLGKFQQMFRTSAGVLDRSRDGALMRGLGRRGLGARVALEPKYDLDVGAKDMSNAYTGIMNRLSGEEMEAENAYQQALLLAMMMGGPGGGGGGGGEEDYGDGGGGEGDTRYSDDPTGLLPKRPYQVNPRSRTARAQPTRVTRNRRPGQAGFRPF